MAAGARSVHLAQTSASEADWRHSTLHVFVAHLVARQRAA
jgi:hypothetical protein